MFGDILQELRQDHGLTQGELATKFNINRTTLSKYETNENEPDLTFLKDCADYFNVSIDYLLGRTKISTPFSILNEFESYPPDVLKKLSYILIYFKNKKYIDYVYSVILAMQNFI